MAEGAGASTEEEDDTDVGTNVEGVDTAGEGSEAKGLIPTPKGLTLWKAGWVGERGEVAGLETGELAGLETGVLTGLGGNAKLVEPLAD